MLTTIYPLFGIQSLLDSDSVILKVIGGIFLVVLLLKLWGIGDDKKK